MAGHTPGPWLQAKTQPRHVIVDGPDGRPKKLIAGVASESAVFTDAEWRANARLIAAAPELLSVLELVASCPEEAECTWIDAIHAALAKARGDS